MVAPVSLLGRNSPSFVIAVALLIAIVGGYVGWRFWWPNPVKRSDRIARQFAADWAGRQGLKR